MSINVGDRVKVIKADGSLSSLVGAIGEVIRIYDLSRTVAAVKITPNENIAREIIVKLPAEYLEKVGSQTQETEIPEGAKEISRGDFEEALEKITDHKKLFSADSDSMSSLVRLMNNKIIGNLAIDKIFKNQDVVVMTEDELVLAMWDACNPVAISDIVGKKMSVHETVVVSAGTIIDLVEIVGILFGGSDD